MSWEIGLIYGAIAASPSPSAIHSVVKRGLSNVGGAGDDSSLRTDCILSPLLLQLASVLVTRDGRS